MHIVSHSLFYSAVLKVLAYIQYNSIFYLHCMLKSLSLLSFLFHSSFFNAIIYSCMHNLKHVIVSLMSLLHEFFQFDTLQTLSERFESAGSASYVLV